MKTKHSVLGIASILFSIPFYILVRLVYTTDRLDTFYRHNFPFSFLAIYVVLPAICVGFAIAALKQKERHKLFAYLGAIVAVPVLLFSAYWSVITIAYIFIAAANK